MLHQSDSGRRASGGLQVIDQYARYLNKFPPHQQLYLTMAGTVKEFPAESLVLAQGSQIEEVYLILRGIVTVGLYQNKSPSLWLYVSGPGTMGDMCALLDPPVSPVSIYALTDVEALAIPRSTFVEVMQQEPALGYEALQALCTRLSFITCLTHERSYKDAPGPSLN